MKSFILWIIAFIITIASAYYQKVTGPTYALKDKKVINNKIINYELERSHSTSSNYLIEINTNDNSIEGLLGWKRFKTNDSITFIKMKNINGLLSSELPAQPSAGKLEYNIFIKNNNQMIPLSEKPVVIRFKGDVPDSVLYPHIILIFMAMLLSTRTGLEIFNKEIYLKKYTTWTLIFITLGGMILGPITQLYAFGDLWTGVPFGWDLTDNKTLIAFIGWIITAIAIKKSTKPKKWVAFAAVLMLVVYLIPHSVLGSELDYNKLDKQKNVQSINN